MVRCPTGLSSTRRRDERFTIYYPPRELAAYVPTYLALLFVYVPMLYMGLNMLSCPGDGIWDTRANDNECGGDNSMGGSAVGNGREDEYTDSIPAVVYDEDVKIVNARIFQQLKQRQAPIGG